MVKILVYLVSIEMMYHKDHGVEVEPKHLSKACFAQRNVRHGRKGKKRVEARFVMLCEGEWGAVAGIRAAAKDASGK